MKYSILTKYGQRYLTDVDGYVLGFSNGLSKDDDSESRKTWQIVGLHEIKAFGHLGDLLSLEKASELSSFTFKNGKPRYTIRDIDHGTTRIHGNTAVHGVVSVKVVY